MTIRDLILVMHIISIAIGAGAALIADVTLAHHLRNQSVTKKVIDQLKHLSIFVRVGLVCAVVAGIGLILLNTALLESETYLAKMTLLAILIINGVVLHVYVFPEIKARYIEKRNSRIKPKLYLLFSSTVVSSITWLSIIYLGVLLPATYNYWLIIGYYFGVLATGAVLAFVMMRRYMEREDRMSLGVLLVASLAFVLVGMIRYQQYIGEQLEVSQLAERGQVYTWEEVNAHNINEDCWVIVDDLVFDVTEPAIIHPALFHCAEDVSKNYHANHGPVIRDKMMQYHIGQLEDTTEEGDQSGEQVSKQVDGSHEMLNPWAELYVEPGSWSAQELMIIVEKSAESLLFIDGSTNEVIGRVQQVGYQPHTSVFSSDAVFMYIISRDGWLTKIDLTSLDVVNTVRVGINSRGTAITVNDRIVAVGNYEPGNVVLLDADSLDTLATIDLVGEINGVETVSRAGALVDYGNSIIVALKDINSVWTIDTEQVGYPVTNTFANIGDNKTTLHDGYLTPDAKYFLVASQGSNTVWVLDMETLEPVKEIQTGDTPHTGPGATWGEYTFIPALGEGLITVVNIETWEIESTITTGGPGLFIRHYDGNPDYPYVWADTAFGERADEIYVIDAAKQEIVETLIPVEGATSFHPEFTLNGEYVYVVVQGADQVFVYDAQTFEVVATIPAVMPSAVSNVGLRITEPGL